MIDKYPMFCILLFTFAFSFNKKLFTAFVKWQTYLYKLRYFYCMQKIASFIMSRKIIPVILALTCASIFIALSSKGNSENSENPKSYHAKVLRNVGILLEQAHYQPKKLNDAFSKEVFIEFIDGLDDDHKIFLASDMQVLEKYSTEIDDEIKGKELKSFYAINDLYNKRQAETELLYKDLLSKPFDFSIKETISGGTKKPAFANTEEERKEAWRKFLKYAVLEKFVALQNVREANKGKDAVKTQTDTQLETEARAAQLKLMDRFYTTRKNRESSDFIFGQFVNTIAIVMDPHTSYFPPIDLRTFNEGMSGSFYGIGAQLLQEDGHIKIGTLMTGLPAWNSKQIKEGDIIEKVAEGNAAPVDVTGYDIYDAIKLIRGEKGTTVTLTMKSIEGTTKVVSIKRDKVDTESTYAQSAIVKEGDKKVGYIYLPEFYANFSEADGRRCAPDVAKEIVKLKAEGVSAIVMDLRGNGGGSLYDVVEMVGFFIDKGPVVQIKTKEGKPQVLNDKTAGTLWDGPLAVMVDEGSASASEIFAAAIQDYKRGIIVGSTSTYGKGTVQRNIPLNPENQSMFSNKKEEPEDLGTVKLTLQKFYRINGDATQNKGVESDVVLADKFEYLKIREKDNPLALNYDQIAGADYQAWNSYFDLNSIITQANQYADTSAVFMKINEEAKKLETSVEREISLNIDDYKKVVKERLATIKELDRLSNLTNKLTVVNLQSNLPSINANKESLARNKSFLELRAKDIYINQTVKIVSEMIKQEALVKAAN